MIKITEKQQKVLDMLKVGMSNKEIAYHMGVKEPTVKMHLTALFKKFKVKNRVQLLIKSTTRKSFQRFALTPISDKKDEYITVPTSCFDAMNDLVLKRSVELAQMRKLLSQEEYRITSLLKRVGEADKIIKYYAEKHGKLKACDYLNKRGVK